MTKHTLQKFDCVYFKTFFIATFDLWMNKGVLDNFYSYYQFLDFGLGIKTYDNWFI
jgi:hypothetical protein